MGYKVTDGKTVGKVLSTDGKNFYNVRKQEKGSWTCSCMAYRFSKGEIGKKRPCKHMLKLWREWRDSINHEANGLRVLEPAML